MLPQLRQSFDRLERTRRELFDRLSRLSRDQLTHQPGENQWSILQVMEHLILSEEQTCHVVTRQLANPRLSAGGNWHLPFRLLVMRLVLRSKLRFKVPHQSVLPSGGLGYDALTKRWEAARQRMATVLKRFDEQLLARPVMRHAVFGSLPIEAVLQFMQEHFNHHLHQIRRIQQSSHFPAN